MSRMNDPNPYRPTASPVSDRREPKKNGSLVTMIVVIAVALLGGFVTALFTGMPAIIYWTALIAVFVAFASMLRKL